MHQPWLLREYLLYLFCLNDPIQCVVHYHKTDNVNEICSTAQVFYRNPKVNSCNQTGNASDDFKNFSIDVQGNICYARSFWIRFELDKYCPFGLATHAN